MQDFAQASDALAEAGFAVPRWVDLPRHCPAPAPDYADPDDPDVLHRGWQRCASRVLDDRASAEHRRAVGPAELAFLDSQPGSFAGSPSALSPQSSPSTLRSSGSCLSVACGSLCLLLLHDAGVGVRSMLWVTTSLPAFGLVFPGHCPGLP